MGFRFILDSGLHVADAATEAPAARDVDDASPLVTAEGRLATTSAETPDAAREPEQRAPLVWLCYATRSC